MTAFPTEREARLMLPGDHFRHDGQLCRVRRISINPERVTIEADIIVGGKIRAGTTIERNPTDPVRTMPPPMTTAPSSRQSELLST